MGGVIGLDYNALYLMAQSLNIWMHPANLDRIQTLEQLDLKWMQMQRSEGNDGS